MFPIEERWRSGGWPASTAVLLLFASGTLAAQNAPNALGQPLLDASGEVRDDAFIQIPLRADDQEYADIHGDRLKGFLMEVDAISLADRDRWPEPSNTVRQRWESCTGSPITSRSGSELEVGPASTLDMKTAWRSVTCSVGGRESR